MTQSSALARRSRSVSDGTVGCPVSSRRVPRRPGSF